jgi:Fe-S-cluster containining protein
MGLGYTNKEPLELAMIISLADRLVLMEKLYAIHAQQCARFDLACTRKCAACCTCNVTLTTLEGLALWRRLEQGAAPDWREHVVAAAVPGRFQPGMTLNEMAARCASGQDIPEESAQADAGPCPLLTGPPAEDLCPVYVVRPFGCRAMVSQDTCSGEDAAQMPDFILALNTVLLQYIEGLDSSGLSGNLTDVLHFMDNPQNRRDYERQLVLEPQGPLLKNRPVSVLMVPPEQRAGMQPVLAAIQTEIKRAFLQSGMKG